MTRLSVLDQSPIRDGGSAADAVAETIKLAKACEALGYSRYWLAEHHNTSAFAGSCPEILAARLAAETSRIRVGSGGVMLSHYSPLKVAEGFRMLETLYPGRIDLGIGRAPGADPRTTAALQAGPEPWGIEAFPSQVKLVVQFLEDAADGAEGFAKDHPYRGIHAMPRGPGLPEVWLLGSSVMSAAYAADLGQAFCFAHFISPDGGERIMDMYQKRFKPSRSCPAPKASVGVSVLCAASDEEAERLSASRNLWVLWLLEGRHRPFPSPEEALATPLSEAQQITLRGINQRAIVGTPDKVRERLLALGRSYGVDEFVVLTITYDFASRLRSYELLAETFGLSRSGA